tara:strand:+ start:6452 stop:7333 length:882 start_codon:yes stop_codon:yes gene_type:complete
MEVKPPTTHHFNLVGIVPTAGQKLDFNFPWHDSLQPIEKDYLAVEQAVFNCAIAGCKTIWIGCSKDMQPLIRYRLGDYIVDPYELNMTTRFANVPHKREIPIYYVPTHPKDAGRRDSLSWSIITAALSSYWVSKKISKWVTPDRYFVAFPYGLFNSYVLEKQRKFINKSRPFCVSYEGKTFKDGLFLPFTFDAEDFIAARKNFRKSEARGSDKNQVPLSPDKSWTGRYFTHDFVFSGVKEEEATIVPLPWYYDISSWDGLKKWLISDYSLDKPKEIILSYHEWNPIGVDNEKK